MWGDCQRHETVANGPFSMQGDARNREKEKADLRLREGQGSLQDELSTSTRGGLCIEGRDRRL